MVRRSTEMSPPPIFSCHTFADFPDPKLLLPLKLKVHSAYGPFNYLLDYGGVRYLCLLTYNKSVSDCAENKCLRKVYEGMERNDDDQMFLGSRECMELFWSFIKEHYEAALEKGGDLVTPRKKSIVRLQVQTVNGRLCAKEHDSELSYREPNPQFCRRFEVINPPRASYESFADYLDIQLFVPLACDVIRNANIRYLVEYGEARYEFSLWYNRSVNDCAENKCFKKVREGFESESSDLIFRGISKSLELFWPFLKQDYEARLENDEERPDPSGKSTVCIEVHTVDGALQMRTHNVVLKHQKDPIDNPFPDLQLFPKAEIEKISKLHGEKVYKVRIKGAYYCVKTIYPSPEGHFLRELRLLREMPVHPNLVPLVGLTDAGEGKIDGLVLPYIPGITLERIMWITAPQAKKWKTQISDVVNFLHSQNIVWGDAKPANVLIDKTSDNAMVIDFGGGCTRRWVDRELAGTKRGDLQGLQRVFDYIDKKSTGFSHTEYKTPDFSYMEF